MSAANIEVDEELIGILRELNQPVDQTATELIVLELYLLGKISSGRAAAILRMSRIAPTRTRQPIGSGRHRSRRRLIE